MITGGDAKVRPPPKFGFAFQFSADVFSVRLIGLLSFFFILGHLRIARTHAQLWLDTNFFLFDELNQETQGGHD